MGLILIFVMETSTRTITNENGIDGPLTHAQSNNHGQDNLTIPSKTNQKPKEFTQIRVLTKVENGQDLDKLQNKRHYSDEKIENTKKKYKYEWQDKLAETQEYRDFKYGIVCVMAPTGTGKTTIPFLSLEIDKEKFTETYFLCPKIDENLIKQHLDRGCQYLKERQTKLDIKNVEPLRDRLRIVFNDGKSYDIIIQSLPSTSKSLLDWVHENIRENVAIYFDEAHKIQTQLGLNHSGPRRNYSKDKMECFQKAQVRNKGQHFKLLQIFATKRKLCLISATLDDITNNDLLPYRGKLPILSLVIQQDTLLEKDINIEPYSWGDKDEILTEVRDKVIEFYNQQKMKKQEERLICIVFVSCRQDQKSLETKLIEKIGNSESIYLWNSSLQEKFDPIKIRDINIFIDKGSTGLDRNDIGMLFVVRKLSDKGSSSRNGEIVENSFSNLFIQIAGRLRKGGKIHWWGAGKKTKYLDLIQLNYESHFHEKQTYNSRFFEIKNLYRYNIAFIDNFLSHYFYSLLTDSFIPGENMTDTLGLFLLAIIKPKFLELQKKIEKMDDPNTFIKEYLEYESYCLNAYMIKYTLYLENIKKSNSKYRLFNEDRNNNMTRGGKSKINITDKVN